MLSKRVEIGGVRSFTFAGFGHLSNFGKSHSESAYRLLRNRLVLCDLILCPAGQPCIEDPLISSLFRVLAVRPFP